MRFFIPEVVRRHSAEVDQGVAEFAERVQPFLLAKVKEVVNRDSEEQAREFLENRKRLAVEGRVWLRKSKM